MTEKYVAEYVEIIDGHGERKGVCVTDTEHTVSFEVKDEIAALRLCELLNKLFGENEELGISIKLFEDDVNRLSKENEQLKKVNNILYNENIQLRRILVNYKDLINDVKYLEEKGVFDGKKDKKNIWDVEPVVEKHS